MQKLANLFITSICLIFLSGCATKHNVELSDKFWKEPKHKHKIAVARTAAPKAQVHQIGGQGLLDMAITSSMAIPVDRHLAKVDLSWYPGLQQSFLNKLRAHKLSAVAIQGSVNLKPLRALNKDINQYADVNYSNIVAPVGGNKLLIIKLNALGAVRHYSSFIPLGPPKAYCSLTGELIDTQNHRILWRYIADVTMQVKGNWDQPPSYPNLTSALKVAMATAQQEVLENFFSGH